MTADDLHCRELLENAAHDQPRQREAIVGRAADARRQPVILHRRRGGIARMDEDRNIQIGHQLEERFRRILVRIVAVMAGIDDDSAGVILLNGALQLFHKLVAAVGHAGRHGDELVRVLVPAPGEMPVRAFDGGDDVFRRLHVPDVMHRVANHSAVEAGERVGPERILHGHRHRNRPPRLAYEFRIVDVNVPVDQQVSLPFQFCPPMIAAKRATRSGGVASVYSTTSRTSSPCPGTISSPCFCASAKKSGSRSVASKAVRSAATRSAGTSGGAIAFQPTLESEFMNSRMRRPSSLDARSLISGRSGRSAWRLSPVWNGTAILPSLSHSPRVVFSAVHDATRASASPRSMARSTSAAPR